MDDRKRPGGKVTTLRTGTGIIGEWSGEEGVGALQVEETGHAVWFSYIHLLRPLLSDQLHLGMRVAVEYKPTEWQDGYTWVATRIERLTPHDGGADR